MILATSVVEDVFRAVLQGAPPGTVYALVAVGFVLTYKTSGVFNLAFGAQAYVSAIVYFKTHTEWGWPALPALVLSVFVLAPLLGFVLEWMIFRHLRTAPAVAKLVVTIGLALGLPAAFGILIDFAPAMGVVPEGILPDGNSVYYDPFGVYAFSRNELVAMTVVLVSVAGLAALFRYSAIGLQMRAVVESPRMTELNGIAADRVSAFAWALSSFFAGMAGVLIAPRFSTLEQSEFFNIVVVAIAAAAVGKLVSLPRALAGGLGLGVLIAVFTTFIPRWSDDLTWLQPIQDNVTPAIPFIVLFGVIVLVPSVRRSVQAADPLSGVDPPPGSQQVARRDGHWVPVSMIVWTVVLGAIGAVLLTRGDVVWVYLVTQGLALSIIYLSITLITGLGGHISLCQGAYAAIGAFAVFQLSDRYDMSVLAGAFVGAGIAALVGAMLSLPIRRLNGIWVAIATLAFAFFFDAVLVKFSWVGGDIVRNDVPRPVIGPWDLADDKQFLVFVTVVLLLSSVAVTLFAKGTVGRQLRALRGSEVASQSIGISPGRGRIIAFATSAFVAGLGGAVLAMHQENVNYGSNFSPFGTLFWLVLVVTLGVRSAGGALAAGAAFTLFPKVILEGNLVAWILRDPERVPGIFPISPQWQFILFGLGTIAYARHPEGVLERSRADFRRRFGGGPATEEPVRHDVDRRDRARTEVEEAVG